MITEKQIKAGRALVDWTAKDLADKSGVSLATIQRMESAGGTDSARGENLKAVQKALEDAGIQFIPENGGGAGVRLRERAQK